MDVQEFVNVENHHPIRCLYLWKGQSMGVRAVAMPFGCGGILADLGDVGDRT